jgi:hypothetical protein
MGRSVGIRAWLSASYGLLALTYMSCWLPSHYHLQPLGFQPLGGLLFLAYLVARALGSEESPESNALPAPSFSARLDSV